MKGFFKISALTCLVLSFILQKHVAAQVTDLQLPTGANVVSGNVTISQEPGKLTINQTSSQAITNRSQIGEIVIGLILVTSFFSKQ